jgi:hypothetical protein
LVIFAGVTTKVDPLQMVVAMVVNDGFGFTVTVTTNVAPVQLPDTGATVYVAVCGLFVVLVSVPVILEAPLPAAPPVKPVPAGADQVYVVPAGTMPLVIFTGDMVKPTPLHTAEFIGVIAGLGFTNIITEKSAPLQLPDIGVTVYIAV